MNNECNDPDCYNDCAQCQAERNGVKFERNCPESGGRVLAKDCGVKSTEKTDYCEKCGYIFQYP